MNDAKYILVGVLFFALQMVYAQNSDTIQIQEERQLYFVGKQTFVLEDSAQALTFDDILKAETQTQFQKLASDFYKTNSKSAFWYKFVIQNQTDEDIWLKLGADALLYADFYAPDTQGNYQVKKVGTLQQKSNEQKEFPYNYHVILLAKSADNQVKTFYVRVRRQYSVPEGFQVGTTYTVTETLRYLDYATAGFIGLIFSTLIYNLFLWYKVRERIYGVYVAHLFAVMLATPTTLGFSFLEIFRTEWFTTNYHVWNNIKYIFQTLFAVYYLNMMVRAKRLYYWNMGLTAVISIVIPMLVLIFGTQDAITSFFTLVVLIYNFSLLFSGVYLWVKKYEEGSYYVIGWGFVMLGVFIAIFEYVGLIQRNLFTQTVTYYGYGSEAVIFALALGNRYNKLKQEKERVQAENLRLVQEQNEKLERKVHERTLQLQERNEEIQQQNEELVTITEQLRDKNDLVQEQYAELDQQTKIIHSAHTKITASINYAERIQKAILPQPQKISMMFPEAFIVFRPRDVVSGDFYWCSFVRDSKGNKKVIFATGDCTGHGVPGAFMSMAGANLLVQIINDRKVSDPAFILDLLHAGIRDLLNQDENENRDGMDISISVVDWDNKMLEYAGAKRPLLYVQNGEMQQIKGDIYPIGGVLRGINRKFTTKSLSFAESPVIAYTFSDGYTDQIGGTKKPRKLMMRNFRNMLFKIHEQSMREQKQFIETTFDKWRGNHRQLDDILVVGMKLE